MAVTSTTGTQAVTQSSWKVLQLEQAKQFAERAAQSARAMQEKANVAQTVADRAQENARTLRVEANQAYSTAVEADRGVRSAESSGRVGEQILVKVTQIAAQPQPVAQETVPPTTNTQGETIGTVINVTA
jgi:hypothetical protein